MPAETVIALANGAGGAIAVLVIGFIAFAGAVIRGTLVPGRYYDEVVKDNEALRDQLYRALENTDRSVEAMEKIVPTRVRRTPRG